MRRKNKGFTLVEMMVVVAIIGVLVGVVTVGVMNAIEKSREQVDIQNLKAAALLLNKAKTDTKKPAEKEINGKGSEIIGKVYTAQTDLNGSTEIKAGQLVTCVQWNQTKVGWQSTTKDVMVGNHKFTATEDEMPKGCGMAYISVDSNGNFHMTLLEK